MAKKRKKRRMGRKKKIGCSVKSVFSCFKDSSIRDFYQGTEGFQLNIVKKRVFKVFSISFQFQFSPESQSN